MMMEERPRILITEDDFENQKFLELLLKKKFIVEVCDSDKTFYQQLAAKEFSVILMDISLKGSKSGLDLTKEIRGIPKYSNIPIVCLTAHAFRKDKENALSAGVDIFLTKPVQNEVLINTLLQVVNKKETAQV